MEKNFISACLVVRNEENCLRRCLDSIKDVVDEILIIHDGPCEDKTIEIAKEYTDQISLAKIIPGSAEFLRHINYEKAKGDWLLNIDADEELSPGLKNNLRSLIKDEEVDMYAFIWPFYSPSGEKVSKNTARYKQILFRRSKFYHLGIPHMVGKTRGKSKGLDLELRHYYKNKTSVWNNILSDIRKNIYRGRSAACMVLHPEKIITYGCDIKEKNLSFSKKLWLKKKFPIFSMLTLPMYSFLYWYFRHRYYREGWVGLQNALNLPLYNLFTCWYIIQIKYFKKEYGN